jgi:Carboxypeptidase regulatory-like domain
VLPGASITVINVDTNVSRMVITDQDGRFYVAALPPGTYRVSAELAGFVTQRSENIVLLLGQSPTVNLSLPPGGVSESITTYALLDHSLRLCISWRFDASARL